jgi:FkbM family methyltransferase
VMESVKRKIADKVGRIFGVSIMRPAVMQQTISGNLQEAVEQYNLSRFLRHFDVDCVFDVGANAGQYAEKLRTKCDYRGPIISFEPIHDLANPLRQKASNQSNWFIEETVLSEKSGPITFNVMASDQFSSIKKPRDEDEQFEGMAVTAAATLEATTLESHFEKYQMKLGFKRPFLKMDTQGSDLDVARGAGRRLKKFVGLQSELSFNPLYANAPTAFEAITFYRSQGFELTALIANNGGYFPRLFEMDCICYRKDALR